MSRIGKLLINVPKTLIRPQPTTSLVIVVVSNLGVVVLSQLVQSKDDRHFRYNSQLVFVL